MKTVKNRTEALHKYLCGRKKEVSVEQGGKIIKLKSMCEINDLDLKQWLFAFSLIEDAKKGISALQLQRNLSVSYPTALKMYHTIRDLMSIENDKVGLAWKM